MKKGQVSIFIIIAILIVGGIVLYFVFSKGINPSQNRGETTEVRELLQKCFEETSEDAVDFVGLQGGYYNLPENSLISFPYSVPFYMDNYKSYLPEKNIIESEISSYIEDNFPQFCFSDEMDLESSGLEIEIGKGGVETTIDSNSIRINSDIQVIVSKNDSVDEYKNFNAIIKPIRMIEILKISDEIVKSESKDPRTMCVTCISDIAEKYNVDIETFETENSNEFVFQLIDNQSFFSLDEEPYLFNFGVRYSFPKCESLEECADEIK